MKYLYRLRGGVGRMWVRRCGVGACLPGCSRAAGGGSRGSSGQVVVWPLPARWARWRRAARRGQRATGTHPSRPCAAIHVSVTLCAAKSMPSFSRRFSSARWPAGPRGGWGAGPRRWGRHEARPCRSASSRARPAAAAPAAAAPQVQAPRRRRPTLQPSTHPCGPCTRRSGWAGWAAAPRSAADTGARTGGRPARNSGRQARHWHSVQHAVQPTCNEHQHVVIRLSTRLLTRH